MVLPYAPVNIILADDHEIFREGFISLIKNQPWITLIAEAPNGKILVELTQKLSPDLIFIDIKMPVMDGVQAARLISKKFPQVGIIALTMFNDDNLIIDMIEAGAKGFLLKNAQKKEVIDAIVTVQNNQTYYCTDIASRLIKLIARNRFDPKRSFQKLDMSEKEKEIICLICQEFSNKEISNQLHMSVRTVEGYRKRILYKTKARNIAGIVTFAIKHNIYVPQ